MYLRKKPNIKVELWDAYNALGQPTGAVKARGEAFAPGEYHLGASLWIVNAAGEVLLQKRALTKRIKPGVWGVPGGSVLAGETSVQGCLREVAEEIGVHLQADHLTLLSRCFGEDSIYDDYVAFVDFPISDAVLQTEEVSEVAWVSHKDVLTLCRRGELMMEDVAELEKMLAAIHARWTPVTKDDLEDGLRRLGVVPGMMLEVHGSLSSFGWVDGGALTVIDVLKNAVGAEGSIVMPSFKNSLPLPLTDEDRRMGLTLKIKLLRGDEEHSGMGIIADTFRGLPNVVTGDELFRVSAWGRDAGKHAASRFRHLIACGGCALLMGGDIYRMSSMHEVEDVLPKEIKRLFEPCPEARQRYPESEWLIEAWSPPARPWYKIQTLAYEKGYIIDTTIGPSKCMLVDVAKVVALYKEALMTDAFGLYGLT